MDTVETKWKQKCSLNYFFEKLSTFISGTPEGQPLNPPPTYLYTQPAVQIQVILFSG